MAEINKLVYILLDEANRPTNLAAFDETDTIASGVLPERVRNSTDAVYDRSSVWESGGTPTLDSAVSGPWQAAADYTSNASGNIADTSGRVNDLESSSASWNETRYLVSTTSGTWETTVDPTLSNGWQGTYAWASGASGVTTDISTVYGPLSSTATTAIAGVAVLAAASGGYDATKTAVDSSSPSWNSAYAYVTSVFNTGDTTNIDVDSGSIINVDSIEGATGQVLEIEAPALTLSSGQTFAQIISESFFNTKAKGNINLSAGTDGSGSITLSCPDTVSLLGGTINIDGFSTDDFAGSATNWVSVYNSVSGASATWNAAGGAGDAWIAGASGHVSALSTVYGPLSGNAETAVTGFIASSAGWNTTKTAVDSSSDDWNYAWTTIDNRETVWNDTASAVSNGSNNWNSAYLWVNASANFWNSAYDYVTSVFNTADTDNIDVASGNIIEVSGITGAANSVLNLVAPALTLSSDTSFIQLISKGFFNTKAEGNINLSAGTDGSGSISLSCPDTLALFGDTINIDGFSTDDFAGSANKWVSVYNSVKDSSTTWDAAGGTGDAWIAGASGVVDDLSTVYGPISGTAGQVNTYVTTVFNTANTTAIVPTVDITLTGTGSTLTVTGTGVTADIQSLDVTTLNGTNGDFTDLTGTNFTSTDATIGTLDVTGGLDVSGSTVLDDVTATGGTLTGLTTIAGLNANITSLTATNFTTTDGNANSWSAVDVSADEVRSRVVSAGTLAGSAGDEISVTDTVNFRGGLIKRLRRIFNTGPFSVSSDGSSLDLDVTGGVLRINTTNWDTDNFGACAINWSEVYDDVGTSGPLWNGTKTTVDNNNANWTEAYNDTNTLGAASGGWDATKSTVDGTFSAARTLNGDLDAAGNNVDDVAVIKGSGGLLIQGDGSGLTTGTVSMYGASVTLSSDTQTSILAAGNLNIDGFVTNDFNGSATNWSNAYDHLTASDTWLGGGGGDLSGEVVGDLDFQAAHKILNLTQIDTSGSNSLNVTANAYNVESNSINYNLAGGTGNVFTISDPGGTYLTSSLAMDLSGIGKATSITVGGTTKNIDQDAVAVGNDILIYNSGANEWVAEQAAFVRTGGGGTITPVGGSTALSLGDTTLDGSGDVDFNNAGTIGFGAQQSFTPSSNTFTTRNILVGNELSSGPDCVANWEGSTVWASGSVLSAGVGCDITLRGDKFFYGPTTINGATTFVGTPTLNTDLDANQNNILNLEKIQNGNVPFTLEVTGTTAARDLTIKNTSELFGTYGNMVFETPGNLSLSGASVDISGTAINNYGPVSITHDSEDDTLYLESNVDTSNAAPVITFQRNSASPANADYLGQLKFRGKSSAGTTRVYSKITSKIGNPLNNSEDGTMEFEVRDSGSNKIALRLKGDSLRTLNTTDFYVDGDVGVGTTTPAQPLDVNGNSIFRGTIDANLNDITNINKLEGGSVKGLDLASPNGDLSISASNGYSVDMRGHAVTLDGSNIFGLSGGAVEVSATGTYIKQESSAYFNMIAGTNMNLTAGGAIKIQGCPFPNPFIQVKADTGLNINSAATVDVTWDVADVSGGGKVADHFSYNFTTTPTSVQVDETGTYEIGFNIMVEDPASTAAQRATHIARVTKNGTAIGPGSIGYVRASSGSNEAAYNMNGYIVELTAGDDIGVEFERKATNTSTVNTIASYDHTLTIKRIG